MNSSSKFEVQSLKLAGGGMEKYYSITESAD